MKNKKILKRISIILSILLLLIDICLYIKMKATWSEIGSKHHQYENASLIIVGAFRYGILIWGILLIPIVWLEYFFTNLLIKIYNKYDDLKRLFLCLITLVVLVTILAFFIRMILLIIITLV